MSKVSNEVLLEKIENIHEQITSLSDMIQTEIKPEIKSNSNFRIQCKSYLAGMTTLASIAGAGIMWLINTLFKLE